jgi:hypothetical protein
MCNQISIRFDIKLYYNFVSVYMDRGLSYSEELFSKLGSPPNSVYSLSYHTDSWDLFHKGKTITTPFVLAMILIIFYHFSG